MMLTPRLRKVAVTAHVLASVGWFGAVAAFLVLAVVGLITDSEQLVRASYLAMGMTGWFAIVPLSLASLLTGVVLSAGTSWGFIRHYWVVIKLVITVVATLVLLVHMQPISALADAATTDSLGAALSVLRGQVVFQAAAALVVLVVATALSVYKPQGKTRRGWRVQQGSGRSVSIRK